MGLSQNFDAGKAYVGNSTRVPENTEAQSGPIPETKPGPPRR